MIQKEWERLAFAFGALYDKNPVVAGVLDLGVNQGWTVEDTLLHLALILATQNEEHKRQLETWLSRSTIAVYVPVGGET
jgi:hypothetical protein